jgi:signal transduction histidine kinase
MVPGLAEIFLACALGTVCHLLHKRRRDRFALRQVLADSMVVGFGTNLALALILLSDTLMNGAAEIGFAGAAAVFLVAPVSMGLLSTLVVLEQRHLNAVESLAETERRMWHSQKMAAIGQLSHKIVHSILNYLTVIVGDAEMARHESRDPAKVNARMDSIMRTVEHMSQMTGELVAFAMPGTLRFRKMDLSKCLVGIDLMLAKVIGSGIEVEVERGRDVGVVEVDPNRIEQVLLHLAINASEAMAGAGRLTIAAAEADLSEKELVRLQAGVRERDRHRGRFAVLSVQDTGCGMADDVACRIFEPFFTTKQKGDNAGLGLSTVYNIVQLHRGFIDVHSSPGAGSTFFIYLPVIE